MPRGKKKSKKQLEEELLKASGEQKRIEEKERLQNIEVETLNRQRLRLAAELEARHKVEEAERLEEESTIVNTMKSSRKQNLEFEQQKRQDLLDWKKFIACNSRPNVAFESEITTYMTMVREEKMTLDLAMKSCHESEEIVGDLMELYCKAREEGDVVRQEWCTYYIRALRDLEIWLIDEATAHFLQHIEKQDSGNHATVNNQWGEQTDRIKVGFWGHLQNKGFRAKQIDHPRVQIGLELPKSIAAQSMGHCIGVRSLYTAYDSVNDMDPSHMPIGGTIRVDLLSIPPFSKRVKGWTIRQIPAPGQELTRLPYPNTEHAASTATTISPCKIEYHVPAHVIVRKTCGAHPTVSWWDSSVDKWSTDGIIEVAWEPDSRKVSFLSHRLAQFSITQERHLDLPYQWWSIRPVGHLVCELTVQAAHYEFHFTISESGLRLKGPELPELHGIMFADCAEITANGGAETDGRLGEPILGREPRIRSPATLLCELRDCGLNLMPEDGDADFLDGYSPKCTATQARAYSDLSEIAAYYDIVSSKHNKRLPKEKALVRVRENPLCEEYDPLDPDCVTDYRSILFFPDKACFVQSLETAPVSEELAPGHLTHSSLYLCFEKEPFPGPEHAETLEKLEVTCCTVRFVESMRQTMALMRLLCFV